MQPVRLPVQGRRCSLALLSCIAITTSVNVLLFAVGSHGDVHPFVGLGIRLRERGHHVAIAANGYFKELVDHANLEYFPLGSAEQYKELAGDPDLWHPSRGPRRVFDSTAKFLRPQFDIASEFAKRGDVVIAASSLALGARIAQDKLGFPLASVHLSPSLFQSIHEPSNIGPLQLVPRRTPSWAWTLIWAIGNCLADSMIAPAVNQLRREVGLPKVSGLLSSYWHSPLRVIGMFPDWYAKQQIDWPKQTVLTGFPLFDEPDLSPISPALEAFLQSGERPIAFTPGSAMWHAHDFFDASVQACVKLGQRGLLLTRHRDHLPATLPPGVIHVHYAPFSRLLPRCAAFVHHGGIGSSAQALAGGVPQLVTPFTHDQPDNADRLMKLGVARVLPASRYTGQRATQELAKLLGSKDVAACCKNVAARFVGVDALGRTCEVIEELAVSSNSPR